MHDFIYEYNGLTTLLLYPIQDNNQINHSILGVIKDNRIRGLSSVVVGDTKDGKRLEYDISGKISLEKYFSTTLTKEQFLKTLLGIMNPIQEASKYMVRIENIIMDCTHIYIDPNTHLVSLICLPLVRNTVPLNLPEFFKRVIINTTFDSKEDIGYVAKMINFLNNKNMVSMDYFKGLLEELLNDSRIVQKNNEKESNKAKLFPRFGRNRKNDRYNIIVNKSNMSIPNIPQEHSYKKQISVTGKLQGSILRIEPMVNGKVVEKRKINRDEGKPFLVREKNNDKVYILLPEFCIGSEQSSVDYFIGDNITISRNHAMILTYKDKYFIVDNNSTNRSYIDGKLLPYQHEEELTHGSKITLSNENFIFNFR